MTFDYEQLNNFYGAANNWLARNAATDSKFHYALNKVLKKINAQLKPYQEKLAEALNDINTDYASVDKDKNLVKDQHKNLVYTPEKNKAANKARLTAQRQYDREVEEAIYEIDPYMAAWVPPLRSDLEDSVNGTERSMALTYEEQDAFEGFVLAPMVVSF